MIAGRGGGVVMLYVFFSFSFLSFFGGLDIYVISYEEEEVFSFLVCFFLLDLLANFSGGFFRSRAARTDVMFRNLLPKEVFTGLFSLLHCLQFDEQCLVPDIYSFFCSGNLLVLVMRGSTNDNDYNACIFFLFIYTITIPTIPRLKRKKSKTAKTRYIQTSFPT